MNKKLQQLLKEYSQQLATLDISRKRAGKYTLAGSAALATMVAGPVELASQTVCGNLGAPTRTVGSCVGDLGFFGDNYCAKFDFDGDGINELQVRYYNVSGVYPAAWFYIDPLATNNQIWSARIDAYFGDPFPVNPTVGYINANGYNIHYSNKLFIVPLSTGSGFGFIAMDARAYTFAQGNHGGAHPVTGQVICCWGYGEVALWGADTGITISDFTITSGDMTDCGNFSAVLPVEFTRFNATAGKKEVLLTWETATETTNAGFEIERSSDGRHFLPIHFIDGQGTTTESNSYQFTDNEVRTGQQYYYRLKQVDYDGSFTYSEVREVTLESDELQVSVFPNPVSDWLNVSVPVLRSGKARLALYSPQGQLLLTREEDVYANGLFRQRLDVSTLTSGVYYLKVEIDGQTIYKRVVV